MRVGDLVTLGRWALAVRSDPAPIEWFVLDDDPVQGPLLLSRFILDCQRYNETLEETTLGESSLRRWLNDEFFRCAFAEVEREQIRLTDCPGNGPGTPETADRVFLLSVDEIRTLTHPGTGNGLDRRAVDTPYATTVRGDGCRLYIYDKSVERDYLNVDGSRQGCSWWWARSQPKAEHSAGVDRRLRRSAEAT